MKLSRDLLLSDRLPVSYRAASRRSGTGWALRWALLLLAFGVFAPSLRAERSVEVERAIAGLDAVYDESFAWWGRVYDPESGGCYYSLSAKRETDDLRFGPDIEAMQKLVRVMEWTGLLEDAPASFKVNVIEHLQRRQDPDSGFFADPQHVEVYTPNTRQRATSMAAGTLERLGAEPQHPLPHERVAESEAAAEHYAYLESPETVRAWLDGLPWETRAWTAGSRIRVRRSDFLRLEAQRRAEYAAIVREAVAEHQREDGLIGNPDDGWWSRLSGTYKIAAFFHGIGEDVPKADAMVESLLRIMEEEEFDNTIVVYNAANLGYILDQRGANFDEAKRIAFVDRVTRLLEAQLAPDGAFATLRGRGASSDSGRPLGLDVFESNTNASGLAHKTRGLMIELLTGKAPPHPHPRGKALIEALRSSGE